MKTSTLLNLSADDLVDSLETMKAKECERHARKITNKLKGPTYNELLALRQNLWVELRFLGMY